MTPSSPASEQPLPRSSAGSAESGQDDSPRRRSHRLLATAATQPVGTSSSTSALDYPPPSRPIIPPHLCQAMELFPKGTVVVSQGLPRTQAIVVGHLASTGSAPMIQVFQAGFLRAHSLHWIPPGLHDRLINKLPYQDQPPTETFPALDYVRNHLARLYPHEASLEAADVAPLVAHLESLRKPQPPSSPLPSHPYAQRAALRELSSHHYPSSSSRETPFMDAPQTTSTPFPGNSALSETATPMQQINDLSRRLGEIDVFLCSSSNPGTNNAVPPRPPLLPSLPLLYDHARSSRNTSRSHSRSRSRSRSRDHSIVRLSKYALINVPCPFADLRAAIPPAARVSGSARQRRFFRRILTDIYVFYPSALLLAQHIIALNRQTGSPILSWEEATLSHWARALDYALLEANGGSWTLWSEPVVDCLLRGFLEMAIRANPDHEPPPGLDPSTAAKLRKLKFGKNRVYGPLPRNNANGQGQHGNSANNQQRRFTYNRWSQDRGGQTGYQPGGQNKHPQTNPPSGGGARRPPTPSA